MDMFISGLNQGLLLAFVAYGIMISFRLLNFSDLSGEGAYSLGGAVAATLLLTTDFTLASIGFAACLGGILSMLTGVIYFRFRIPPLLGGILISTMAYSIGYKIVGCPNVGLHGASTLLEVLGPYDSILTLSVLLGSLILPFYIFLQTETGLKFRAIGLNPVYGKNAGLSIVSYTLAGLFFSGALTGLGGALMVHSQKYMDIGMGGGIVIHGLAALMMGEALVGQASLQSKFWAPLMGALGYQQILGLAFSLGLPPTDLKLFTGATVLGIVAYQSHRKGLNISYFS